MSKQAVRPTSPQKLKTESKDIPSTKGETPEIAEILRQLPPEQREAVMQIIKEESFSGPIPHPELLRGYEIIQTGFAERIVHMAEKEQEHRFEREDKQMECEKLVITEAAAESKRGQWFAGIIAVLFLAGSVVLGMYGHDSVASILGGGTLVSIVTVYITGRKMPSNKTEQPK